jgi:radical SAM superfamily enzyme YgiQ (UPF0313 family)
LTFNVNEKKVFEICNEFKKRNLPVWWWGLFRLDRLSREMLLELKEAKCVKLSIGLETVNDEIAHDIKGDYYLIRKEYMDILQFADEIGLIIKAFLMIGFLDDTKDKIRSYVGRLLELPIDEIRVTFLTPFPGTQYWDVFKERTIYSTKSSWVDFTTEEPVILHPSLDKNELIDLRHEIVSNFYQDQEYTYHMTNKIRRYPELRDSFLEYFMFLEDKAVLGDSNYNFNHFKK